LTTSATAAQCVEDLTAARALGSVQQQACLHTADDVGAFLLDLARVVNLQLDFIGRNLAARAMACNAWRPVASPAR